MSIMDYLEFKKRAVGKKAIFSQTLKQLKKHKHKQVDALFHQAHQEAFQEISCLTCAFCCKYVGPRWTQQDIQRVSRHLKMKESDFVETYVRSDEDDDFVFQSMPCPFLLDDNKCMIYEVRPKACREYPHTDRRKIKQIFDLTLTNSSCCPAVELILDKIGTQL